MTDLNLHPAVSIPVTRGTQRACFLAHTLRILVVAVVLVPIPVYSTAYAQTVPAPTSGRGTASPLEVSTRAGAYRIEPGDVLQYRVWPNAELTGEFPVESAGVVYLPVLGAVHVGGKTLDEVRVLLRDMYGKLVQGNTQPVVTVTAQFAYSVMGAVRTPGVFDGHAGMTVFDAVSGSGGYRDDAMPTYVDVIHADGSTTRLETSVGAPTPLTGVVLQSQDHVVVPVAHKAFSMQNIYPIAQLVLSLITVVKVLGK